MISEGITESAGARPTEGTEVKPGDCYRGSDGALTCALCDNEMDWHECQECNGDGFIDCSEDDPLNFSRGEEAECHQCNGEGGDHWCPDRSCKTLVCHRVITKPSGLSALNSQLSAPSGK